MSGDSPKPSSLSDQGIKYLCGTIDLDSCRPVIEWILEENAVNKREKLTLIVSSRGGDLAACFALVDAILGSSIPVQTVGLGCIASAGLAVFMHGKHRILTPNTYVLAHQYSAWRAGKEHELVASRKAEDWMSERCLAMFVRQSKLSPDEVKRVLLGPSDTFLTAEETLSYGLADEIRINPH